MEGSYAAKAASCQAQHPKHWDGLKDLNLLLCLWREGERDEEEEGGGRRVRGGEFTSDPHCSFWTLCGNYYSVGAKHAASRPYCRVTFQWLLKSEPFSSHIRMSDQKKLRSSWEAQRRFPVLHSGWGVFRPLGDDWRKWKSMQTLCPFKGDQRDRRVSDSELEDF